MPSSRDLPDPGIEPASPALADEFFTTSATWEAQISVEITLFHHGYQYSASYMNP